MGKNRIIKILGNIIGNLVVHKILIKYTNKPESINYLNSEIVEYRDVAFSTASEFNLNKEDIDYIKSKSFRKES